jgi:hypothetical protein
VPDADFPAGHAPALDFDFGVVDEVPGAVEIAAQRNRGLADGVAVDEARKPDFVVFAQPAVDVVLVGASDRLVVAVGAAGKAQAPVAERQGIMDAAPARAAPAGLVAAEIVAETGIEEIVEREQVVAGQG